jgi:LEA14-like dessication related protein
MNLSFLRSLSPALLAGVAACAAVSDLFREPEVELQQVVVRGISASGGNLDLLVQIHNPNRFDLRGTDLQLGFAVEGTHVGDVRYEDDYTVQQGDTAVMTLPLRFEWSGVSTALRAALTSGNIPYTMQGQVRLDTPIGARTVDFTQSGRVPLARAAGIVIPRGGT